MECLKNGHYKVNGNVAAAEVKNCPHFHGDDRRRHICQYDFYNNYKDDYSLSIGLCELIASLKTNPSARSNLTKFYLAYCNRQCTNYEHFLSRQTEEQQRKTEQCQYCHG